MEGALIAVGSLDVGKAQIVGRDALADGRAARHRRGSECAPVIAVPAGNHLDFARLAPLLVVHLSDEQGHFVGNGAARGEGHPVHPRRSQSCDHLGQLLLGCCSELAFVDKGEFAQLGRHRVGHLLHPVADADHVGSGDDVQITFAVGIV